MDTTNSIQIPIHQATLNGILEIPPNARGIILFAHGSGSSRFSVRNQQVAKVLNEAQFATLLFDLLTDEEEGIDEYSLELRFDIELLASRLVAVTNWVLKAPTTRHLAIGYFGASTGGAAALIAATKNPQAVKAIVSRGGRPDLAGTALSEVQAPTLLIVGGNDDVVIELNQKAMKQLQGIKQLEIVPGATHLFEEPGTLDEVSLLAKTWFMKYLGHANL